MPSRYNQKTPEELVKQLKYKIGGIQPNHLVELQKYSSEQQCIIGFRSVENVAGDWIAAGYPTKSFHIKGKSSSWGPQAGFIPVEQKYSKVQGSRFKVQGSRFK
ncbi:anthrax toxin-like adenylyl cyclase domain-containing protein [Xenorhabdus hominickii]|uniref:Type III secretion system effector ExoY, adenylate cyclase n=1 Tax=Xenorhabdus hominickii TaxID=351679 RepID=A0A2G0Q1Q9_XENHO|nr:anthrax toxin-like adenylyl cyclase domain-containing protein [Xenorhabdus hominickii]AOM40339.1 hypothetical protein A9255_06940 [Xenorhabdus hominickii]PHM53146.1 type III secretion system effector ExoY, adenylate cyclase [Xenorhabdus hominickii]